MKLSDMKRTETKNTSTSATSSSSSKNSNKGVQEAYDELKNCSQDELMARLVGEIQQQKNMGVFDYDLLRSSIEKIKVYLPKENYENMIKIIDGLK